MWARGIIDSEWPPRGNLVIALWWPFIVQGASPTGCDRDTSRRRSSTLTAYGRGHFLLYGRLPYPILFLRMKDIVVFFWVEEQVDGGFILLITAETVLYSTPLIIVDGHEVGLDKLADDLLNCSRGPSRRCVSASSRWHRTPVLHRRSNPQTLRA